MKKPITFIYFDVGGVFLDWKKGIRRAAEKYGVAYDDIARVVTAHWEVSGRGGDTAPYMRDLARLLNIPAPYPEVTDFWTDYHVPIPEMHEFVRSLPKSYRLGIITNAERNAMKHASRKKLIPDMAWEAIVDSSEIGYVKPEAQIYDAAEKAAGVAPAELLFTDDVPEHIDAVRARGWHGVVFDPDDIPGSIKRIRKELGMVPNRK